MIDRIIFLLSKASKRTLLLCFKTKIIHSFIACMVIWNSPSHHVFGMAIRISTSAMQLMQGFIEDMLMMLLT